MLAVRLLHVLGMALALGGATLTWWLFRRDAASESPTLDVAAAYERGFWAATGVIVMTGVGNLGSLAPFVPTAGTRWGAAFTAKLLVVLLVLALSVVRTLVVARCRRTARRCTRVGADSESTTEQSGQSTEISSGDTEMPSRRAEWSDRGTETLRVAYGATALSLALLVALAEVLAHG
ncbi:hypothetical protein [Halorussus sp. MSC15.2]|uniref:hypothetical protein n=1 Tax=Halorussus sp. MSC15.2 TaxID=2283638 RepID=UPI0013D81569|nr:hypothetical protein [Halorussus sp. MSC15.2]NEU56810.1 hypothetical protein [Halorussus sp. MSC15.2]